MTRSATLEGGGVLEMYVPSWRWPPGTSGETLPVVRTYGAELHAHPRLDDPHVPNQMMDTTPISNQTMLPSRRSSCSGSDHLGPGALLAPLADEEHGLDSKQYVQDR